MGRIFKATKRASPTTNRQAAISYTLHDHHVPERRETDEDGNTVTIEGYDVEVIAERYERTKTVKGKKIPDGFGYSVKVMNWPTSGWRGTNAVTVLQVLTADGIELSDWLYDLAVFIDDLLTEQDDDGDAVSREFIAIWNAAHELATDALNAANGKPESGTARRRRPRRMGDSAKEAS